MSDNYSSGEARFGGTDPLDSIADLDKVDELQETLEVTDPSPLPPVPLDPVTGNAAVAVTGSGGSDAVDADVALSQAAPAATRDPDFAALPGQTGDQNGGENGTGVLGVARASSLPLALLSLGLALFLRNRRQSGTRPAASTPPINVSPGAAAAAAAAVRATGDALSEAGRKVADVGAPVIHRAGDVAQSVTSSVGGAASDLGSAAAAKTGQTKDFLGRTMQENPLALGAVVLLLGAAVGLLIPGTRKEDALMGEARDNLLGKAQEIVSDVRETVTTVATTAVQEVRETVTQAAQEVAQDVKATAQEAGDTLKTELTEEAKSHGLVADASAPPDDAPAPENAPAT